MSDWPTSWREALLRQCGIPVTRFALDVLSAWRKSTPLEPWTNNPLGMPVAGTRAPNVLGSGYAAFPGMDAFRSAFALFLVSPAGRPVFDALATQDKPSVAWRAAHALPWPAVKTETNWPAVILDLIPTASRPLPDEDTSGTARTSGTIGVSGKSRSQGSAQVNASQQALIALNAGTRALQGIIRKVT